MTTKHTNPCLRMYKDSKKIIGKKEACDYVAIKLALIIQELEKSGDLTDEKFEQALNDEAEWTEKAVKKSRPAKAA